LKPLSLFYPSFVSTTQHRVVFGPISHWQLPAHNAIPRASTACRHRAYLVRRETELLNRVNIQVVNTQTPGHYRPHQSIHVHQHDQKTRLTVVQPVLDGFFIPRIVKFMQCMRHHLSASPLCPGRPQPDDKMTTTTAPPSPRPSTFLTHTFSRNSDCHHCYECNPARPEQHVTTRVAPKSHSTRNLGHIPDMCHW